MRGLTVRLTYSGAEPVIVPDAGLTVDPNDTVDIPDEIASSLLARPDWQKAAKPEADSVKEN